MRVYGTEKSAGGTDCFARKVPRQGSDGQHQCDKAHDGQQHKADKHEDKQQADQQGKGDGDLEVQCFFALIVHKRHLIFLELPHDQRPEQVAEGNDESGQGGQVRKHTPLVLLNG